MRERCAFLCEGIAERSALEGDALFVLGFGFDGTACFRKGARQGPDALREAFRGIETYSPYLGRDLTQYNNLFDLGNLSCGSDQSEGDFLEALDHFSQIVGDRHFGSDAIKLVTLGGEHSVSYAPLLKYLKDFDDLLIVHLDAHADLRDGYQGYRYSHASVMRRVCEHFGPGHDLVQYGIRSGTRDEFAYMEKRGTLASSRGEFWERLGREPIDRPIYLTLDLDFFDPAFCPGTGTPEAGGEDFRFFAELVQLLSSRNFVGADIVELAPEVDPTGNSSVFGAKVLRETVLAMV